MRCWSIVLWPFKFPIFKKSISRCHIHNYKQFGRITQNKLFSQTCTTSAKGASGYHAIVGMGRINPNILQYCYYTLHCHCIHRVRPQLIGRKSLHLHFLFSTICSSQQPSGCLAKPSAGSCRTVPSPHPPLYPKIPLRISHTGC